MAKQIKNTDLIEKGVFAPTVKSAEDLIKALDKLELGFVEVAKTAKKELKGVKIVDLQNVEAATKAIKSADSASKGLNATQKERIKIREKLKQANSTAIDQNTRLKVQLQQQNKVNKDLARDQLGLIGAYEKASKTLNTLRKRYKDLAISEGASSKGAIRLRNEITKLDAKLKKADASTGQFQRNVGNYPKGLGRATNALKGFAGALGITAGITGLVRALGGSIKIAKEFEQSNANLAAVLGKSKDEIGALTEDAKRLGAATAFTASQVSELQTEFAKLGFNEQEILNATEATLSLAAATGSDLGEAAAIAGATLGGFGLGAEETQRVVDVMAKSFSTSALDIEKFKESMKNAAPAAKAVGIDVEETTALLGTLANAGISGSKAGNNLKTSFINLNKAGLTLQQGLDKVANSEDKLGTAADLVGKNAAASFLVLSEGVDVTAKLSRGLRSAGGAAEKMAKEQLNTLEGSLTILNSAYEGFVLGILSGDSAFNKFSRSLVEGTTALLGMLTPAAELADAWFKQRDEVQQLEENLNPLLDRYDELTASTELTAEEQEELDSIIQQVAETVPTAVTAFDEYGKALDISTTAATKFIKQQKDLLALDNAAAITEQEEAIVILNNRLNNLNNEYFILNGELVKYDRQLKQNIKADAAEIREFSKRGAAIRDEIELRDAKIALLKGEKTEAELAAEAEKELAEETEEQVVTLRLLNEQLSALKTLRKDINVEDKEGLKTNKKEIDDLQALIDLIEGKGKATKKAKNREKEARNKEQEELDKFLNDKEKAEGDFFDSKLSKEDQEIRAVEEKYFRLIELAEIYNVDSTQLEKDRQSQLDEIRLKARNKEEADEAARLKSLKAQYDAAQEKIKNDELAARKESLNTAIDTASQTVDIFDESFNEILDKRSAALDEEAKQSQDNLSRQEELAAQGVEGAAERAAFERQKQAEIAIQQREIEQKRRFEEQAAQLVSTYFNFLDARTSSAETDAEVNAAAGKALQDTAKAATIGAGAKGLAGLVAGAAFDGTEDTGGAGTLDSKGGKLWILHPHEGVVKREANENYSGLVGAMNSGDVDSWIMKNIMIQPNMNFDSRTKEDEIERSYQQLSVEMQGVKKAIENKPVQNIDADGLGNIIETIIANGAKHTTMHQRTKRKI